MNTNRIKLVQLVGELLIPLLGYFVWNWNFYFIAFFYFLDLVANTAFLFPKLQKFKNFEQKKQSIAIHFSAYSLVLAILFYLGVNFSSQIIANFDFKEQSIAFFLLKDMGLPQGFFLIPLVILAAYMQYKQEFLLTKKYEKISLELQLRKHSQGLLLSVALLALALTTAKFVIIPEIVAVLGLIGLSGIYSYWMKR